MNSTLHLFEGYGIELEYMIVDKQSLAVKPIADKVIYSVTGDFSPDVQLNGIAWSNELVLHVIEIKTNGPRNNLNGLEKLFNENIWKINKILSKHNAVLLPTGAHPFMDPFSEMKLWPHKHNLTYDTYNKIFDCRGHGWSNLQSNHLNLPFANDDEFKKLHSAVRLLLPIIPAVSASTPIIDGKFSGFLDTRLKVYADNQKKIPSITGKVIPEKIFSKKDYKKNILNKIYEDIYPFDKEKILQKEWLNSRGAVARFERNTIEIRIIDTQECASADMAIINLIVNTLKLIISEKWQKLEEQMEWHEKRLAGIFFKIIEKGEDSLIDDGDYLLLFNFTKAEKCTAKELWHHILSEIKTNMNNKNQCWIEIMETILIKGSLSSRILQSLADDFSRRSIVNTYNKLANCLSDDKLFLA